MSETAITKLCLLDLSKEDGVRVWRNNTGALKNQSGQLVRFGLPGSGDILGLKRIVITPEMVGQIIGRFIAIETKTKTGKQRDQQERFEEMVIGHGGLYVVARSAEEAVNGINGVEI
ncbi:MAG: VRR-NUC domain-containing protein [Halopseudomonas aestusnigri]